MLKKEKTSSVSRIKFLPVILSALLLAQNVLAQSYLYVSQSSSTEQLGTATGVDVVTDALGYTYVVGDYDNGVNFGGIEIAGNYGTMYVAKYNPQGVVMWVRFINGNSNNLMKGVDIDQGANLYIIGEYKHTNSFTELDFGTFSVTGNGSSSTFIAKIDSAGNWQWANTILSTGPSAVNGKRVRPHDIVWTPEGPIVAGDIEEQVTIDNQTYNNINENTFFFAKFNNDGDLTWFEQGTGFVTRLRLQPGPSGSFYFVGNGVGTGITMNAGNPLDLLGGGDVLFGAINSTGSLQWWKAFGHQAENNYSPDISLDADYNIYLTSTNPFFLQIADSTVYRVDGTNWQLLKFSSTGNFQWMKPISENFSGYTYNTLTSPQGTTYVTGFIEDAFHFWPAQFWGDSIGGFGQKEAYFAAYGSDGTFLDVSSFVFTDSIDASLVREFIPGEMRFDNEGHILMAGKWCGSIAIGNDSLTNPAWTHQTHMFLLKIDPSQLFDLTAGIEDGNLARANFILYPNPATDQITIEMNAPEQGSNYRIINSVGQLMHQGSLTGPLAEIPVGNLAVGIYFIHVFDEQESAVQRFVKR